MPSLIFFFNDISNVLSDDSYLCLTIPDKRFCFDFYRTPTSFAEAYYIYVNNIKNNPIAVLDFLSNYIDHNEPQSFWRDNIFLDFYNNKLKRDNLEILNTFEQTLKGSYVDVHFSVFTPNSFLFLILNMISFSLLPFKISDFYYTKLNKLDFNVILKHEPKLLVKDNDVLRTNEINNIFALLRSNLDIENTLLLQKQADISIIYQLEYFKFPKYWFGTSLLFNIAKYYIKNNKILYYCCCYYPFYQIFKYAKKIIKNIICVFLF
jgi:hypothetical protein